MLAATIAAPFVAAAQPQLTQSGQALARARQHDGDAVEASHYPVGTRVRLVRSFDGCAGGAVGTVVGFYRTDPPTYAVTIERKPLRIPPEYLAAIDERE